MSPMITLEKESLNSRICNGGDGRREQERWNFQSAKLSKGEGGC